ncbi:hypothetical protein PR048_019904, partial [Dryococelus australis]
MLVITADDRKLPPFVETNFKKSEIASGNLHACTAHGADGQLTYARLKDGVAETAWSNITTYVNVSACLHLKKFVARFVLSGTRSQKKLCPK